MKPATPEAGGQSIYSDAILSARRRRWLVDQQIAGALGAHRLAEGEALRIFTPELVKLDGIGVRFGAFRHDFHPEIVCQRDDRPQDDRSRSARRRAHE